MMLLQDTVLNGLPISLSPEFLEEWTWRQKLFPSVVQAPVKTDSVVYCITV